tara:strand:- start:56 stop:235 length:180 start_codon:yes stop_codon:yes gene_type:complete
MRYVKLTEAQAKQINSKKIGLTSGKRDKETGTRLTIKFCSSLDFTIAFGYDIEREFINI